MDVYNTRTVLGWYCIRASYARATMSYGTPIKNGKVSMADVKADLEARIESGEGQVASFERPLNFETNEIISVMHTIDFDASLNALHDDAALRTWTAHPDKRLLSDGDKLVPISTRITAIRNSTKLPLGVKFQNLTITAPQIIGSKYARADVDVLLPPKTSAHGLKRNLFQANNNSVAMALHPSAVNSQLANITEESLSQGVEVQENNGAHFMDPNSQLGQEIGGLYQIGRIAIGDDFQITQKYGGDAYIVSEQLANSVKKCLLDQRKQLPFCDPAEVSAELVRLDGHDFNSLHGLVDVGSEIEQFQAGTETRKQNQISVDIEAEYVVARAAAQ